MSVDSLVSRVLTTYKADTSDHKAAIRSLRGEEKAAAQARLLEIERTNKGIDSQIAMWGKLAMGVGAAYAAFKAAQVAANAYLEDVRLESAAAGANIDALADATAGLVEQDDLLAFAGKSMHGVWKLNQQEMQTVLQAAMALRKTMGVELQPTIEALTESVTKGTTRGLKEFGIEAKDKTEAMRKMREMVSGLGGDFSLAGDDIQRSKTSMANSVDDLKGALGSLVVSLGPAIKTLAELVDIVSKAVSLLTSAGRSKTSDQIAGVDGEGGSTLDHLRRESSRLQKNYKDMLEVAPALADDVKKEWELVQFRLNREEKVAATKLAAVQKNADAAQDTWKLFWDATMGALEVAATAPKAKRGKPGRASSANTDGLEDTVNTARGLGRATSDALASLSQQAVRAYQGYESLGTTQFTGPGSETQAAASDAVDAGKELTRAFAEAIKLRDEAAKGPTMQELIFGNAEDAEMASGFMESAVGGLNTLKVAAADAYTDMIVHGDNMASSMNKALAQVLYGLSKEFFVRSLGAFAWGNFASGGAFLAASTAAALAARELGAGAASRPSAGGAGGTRGARDVSPRNSSSGPGERNVTIILDDSYYDETKRERSARLSRAIRTGMNDPGTNSIRHG
jgi:hypothetical protein